MVLQFLLTYTHNTCNRCKNKITCWCRFAEQKLYLDKCYHDSCDLGNLNTAGNTRFFCKDQLSKGRVKKMSPREFELWSKSGGYAK